MKYLVVLEKGPKGWGAHVPDLPGCIAVAKTRHGVTKLIAEAIEFHIDGIRQAGEKVPAPRSEAKIVEIEAA